jgi:hypothetical protein
MVNLVFNLAVGYSRQQGGAADGGSAWTKGLRNPGAAGEGNAASLTTLEEGPCCLRDAIC